jgi:recombination protein RecT
MTTENATPETPATTPAAFKPRPPATVRDVVNSETFAAAIGKAIPSHMTPARFIRVAQTALNKTPALLETTPASFCLAILTAAQMGLEPDGRLAHLIPYGKTCTLILDYKGKVELAMRTGKISNIHADVIREGDIFEYGMGEVSNHVPHFIRRDAAKPEKAGEVWGAYAVVRFKDGTSKAEVLSRDEIEAIRKRSRAGGSGPWVTDWNEMAKKTAFHRCSKWIPTSPEFRDAMDRDGDSFEPPAVDVTASVEASDVLRDFRLSEGNDQPEL